MEIVIYQTPF